MEQELVAEAVLVSLEQELAVALVQVSQVLELAVAQAQEPASLVQAVAVDKQVVVAAKQEAAAQWVALPQAAETRDNRVLK